MAELRVGTHECGTLLTPACPSKLQGSQLAHKSRRFRGMKCFVDRFGGNIFAGRCRRCWFGFDRTQSWLFLVGVDEGLTWCFVCCCKACWKVFPAFRAEHYERTKRVLSTFCNHVVCDSEGLPFSQKIRMSLHCISGSLKYWTRVVGLVYFLHYCAARRSETSSTGSSLICSSTSNASELLRKTAACFLFLVVLSVDTAVAPYLGDLSLESATWCCLRACYRLGWVSATLLGSPCETFSEARHQPLEPGRLKPKAMRSSERLFGLDHLGGAEYAQLYMGSAFFLQGALALSEHLARGGLYISEHPAPPQDPSRATIWRPSILSLLQRRPQVRFQVVPQYCWDAPAVKPTGLLTCELPHFKRHLWSRANPAAIRPTTGAIGRNGTGFRTAGLKEYPQKLCQGLATAIVSRLKEAHQRGDTCTILSTGCHEAWQWVQELAQASSKIREGTTWLPDYQG